MLKFYKLEIIQLVYNPIQVHDNLIQVISCEYTYLLVIYYFKGNLAKGLQINKI